MPLPDALLDLDGQWTGDNSLWLNPDAEPRRSGAAAEISAEAEGSAICVRYSWEDRGAPHSGVLLAVADPKSTAVSGSFTDSFHYAGQLMECRGSSDELGVSVHGTYAAPPGDDWGWRITLHVTATDQCALRMFNISPTGDEVLAVEMTLTRDSW